MWENTVFRFDSTSAGSRALAGATRLCRRHGFIFGLSKMTEPSGGGPGVSPPPLITKKPICTLMFAWSDFEEVFKFDFGKILVQSSRNTKLVFRVVCTKTKRKKILGVLSCLLFRLVCTKNFPVNFYLSFLIRPCKHQSTKTLGFFSFSFGANNSNIFQQEFPVSFVCSVW